MRFSIWTRPLLYSFVRARKARWLSAMRSASLACHDPENSQPGGRGVAMGRKVIFLQVALFHWGYLYTVEQHAGK
jgi:hypothetical protein